MDSFRRIQEQLDRMNRQMEYMTRPSKSILAIEQAVENMERPYRLMEQQIKKQEALFEAIRKPYEMAERILATQRRMVNLAAFSPAIPNLESILEMPTSTFVERASDFNKRDPQQFAAVVDSFSAPEVMSKEEWDSELKEKAHATAIKAKKSVRNVLSPKYLKQGFFVLLYMTVVSWGVGFDMGETARSLGESFIATKLPKSEEKNKKEGQKSDQS